MVAAPIRKGAEYPHVPLAPPKQGEAHGQAPTPTEADYRYLLTVARRQSRPDLAIEAEDLVQEVLVALLRAGVSPRFVSRQHRLAYLARAVRNRARDAQRHQASFPREALASMAARIADAEEDALRNLALDAILDRVAADPRLLPLVLLGLGYRQDEVAQALGVKLGALRMRLHRARQEC